MHDIVARVPALGFIDLSRVLVFARPGRSSADGAYASCHSLGLPTSEPGYFFWRDRTHRRSHPPHRMVRHQVARGLRRRQLMNYMISFALPRFTDQTLSRSRKRDALSAGHAGLGGQARHGHSRALPHRSRAELPAPLHSRRRHASRCAAQRRRTSKTSPRWCSSIWRAIPTRACSSSSSYDFEGLRARYGGVGGDDVPIFPVVSAALSRGRGRPAAAGRHRRRRRSRRVDRRRRPRGLRATTICSCASSRARLAADRQLHGRSRGLRRRRRHRRPARLIHPLARR